MRVYLKAQNSGCTSKAQGMARVTKHCSPAIRGAACWEEELSPIFLHKGTVRQGSALSSFCFQHKYLHFFLALELKQAASPGRWETFACRCLSNCCSCKPWWCQMLFVKPGNRKALFGFINKKKLFLFAFINTNIWKQPCHSLPLSLGGWNHLHPSQSIQNMPRGTNLISALWELASCTSVMQILLIRP